MKFCWSTLQVKDLDESIEFYCGILGLSVERRFQAGPAVEIAFLGEGETKIELICDRGKEKIEIGPDISWGFVIETADDIYEELKAGRSQITGYPSIFFTHVPTMLWQRIRRISYDKW